jgi:hypothetical protein
MRLLIAMDTVVGFPAVLRRSPARFGVPAGDVDAEVEEVRAFQARDLASRTFTYRRSDGVAQTLSLADVVARREHFEIAYNPNDCVEIRWGAPPGAPERASCRRHAPAFQRALMAEYREWFATRRRPLW